MAVYFIQAVDGGPIKIGQSDNVPVRLKALEATYGCPLALLATMPGGYAEEKSIHRKFAHLRFPKTEQFRPDPDLLAFIGRPLFVSASPVVEAMPSTSVAVTIKGNPEWRAWVERLAAHCRMSVSGLIDFSLLQTAKKQGFTERPPER